MNETTLQQPTGQSRSIASRILRFVAGLLGALVLLAGLLLGLQRLASERVEVVELHTVDAAGEPVTTRLWVVDDAGYQYLRVGGDGSGWFSRLQAMAVIELSRGGERERYQPVLRPEKSARINDLMQAKYTWGDSFIAALVGSRDGSIPIELQPLP